MDWAQVDSIFGVVPRTVFPLNFSLRMAAGAMASTDETLVNLRDTPSTETITLRYVHGCLFNGRMLSRNQLSIMEGMFHKNAKPTEEIANLIMLPKATIEVLMN